MSRRRLQIQTHTWHIPNGDVRGWTSYLDSHSGCIHPPGALHTLDRAGVLQCLTWSHIPSPAVGFLEARRKMVAGDGDDLGAVAES